MRRGKCTGERREILPVEDDEDQAMLAMRAMRKHGIADEVDRVVVASGGEEALDYPFGRGRYDGRDTCVMPESVLLDVDLPSVTGLKALETLWADGRTAILPIILFSAASSRGDVVEGYKLGANSCVTKPTDFDDFSAAMSPLGWYWPNWNEPPQSGVLAQPRASGRRRFGPTAVHLGVAAAGQRPAP